ncbi:hypothetical protein XENTR_v10001688 [Xenopus tropicalis]|nr:caspase activity and apoptosis inhibitor 1 isoform X2 [Xenopus tropicalis]XP_004910904.1 caspase activity and apoptosis inhibitor 1 isoform X2 [Xenopus tropicalis]KAE8632833.1 hypothetical protein XENTR_v10001688 [Xenopus tropicalis]KAE8632834.1 hypothetical protein XENTR_v10001688 [Xenopus tropicalis]|eukprot:XP_004910903.1 PREDICTED: caspase activity and apoptosis inhibitor 1 isoform X2 [Xenopus tropicalis]
MAGAKKSSKEKKKRRRSDSCEGGTRVERKRRSTDVSHTQHESDISHLAAATKEEEEDEPSDIEEGGLDLNVPLKPISFYISDKKEMLQQCFRVVGEKKLHKMLPDLLKVYSTDEIKQMCLEQLELLSEKKLLKILDGEQGIDSATEEETIGHVGNSEIITQQDNNVDSTSSLRDIAGVEESDTKTGRGEDFDAISINADTYDSDIEGASCEERNTDASATLPIKAAEQPDDLVMDIEKSVSEILGLAEPLSEEIPPAAVNVLPEDVQPSAQQLDLLELEMRARAIKALMKAGDVKKS